jgi:hypothetical protein
MSSRTSIRQFISTYEPVGAQVGDEWCNSATNILYKRTLVNGVVDWVAIGGVTVANDNNTNADRFLVWEDISTGSATTVGVSSTKLFFNPSTGTLSSTHFNSLSDANAKEQIQTIEKALEKTLALRGVGYVLKESQQQQIGVIAQEVETIIPEVVSTSNNGTKSVSYGNIVGLLIEAIKEQQQQIDELKLILRNK